MTFDDFLPFIWPSCTTCPRDTVVHHTRLAAIDFCWRTHVWREDLDTLLGDGFSNDYALALDDQTEVAKLLAVTVKDSSTARPVEHTIVESIEGRSLMRSGCTDPVAWTNDRRTLFLLPTPRQGAEIDVFAALKPSLSAFSFPAEVFAHHAQEIAHGALARILAMPKGDWTDTATAALELAAFNSAVSSAAIQTERGFARKARTSASRFF